MSQKDDPFHDEPEVLNRRFFLKLSAISAGAIAAASTLVGCNGSSDDDDAGDTPTTPLTAVIPSASAWSFGIISDTQWTKDDDGENPASCAVDIINSLNDRFISHGTAFVIHVGDLTDDGRNDTFDAYSTKTEETYTYTCADAFGVRARYAQKLYNNGIGFFPIRGNHDDSAIGAEQFAIYFPQTQSGENNVTSVQDSAFAAQNPDTDDLPDITRTNTQSFVMGSNFSSPDAVASALAGLSYAFDYQSVRFVFLDQFTTADESAYSVASQQAWISDTLSSRDSGTHAFVFSHKGLMTENHADTVFGTNPANADSTGDGVSEPSKTDQDAFITALDTNGVRYHFCGHDHMHDRSFVYTTDATTAKVTQVVTASDSSKFYTPQNPSNDDSYGGGVRQAILAQELYKIGYYIVTVDGDHVTVDYYGAPSYSDNSIDTTPALNFTLRESFGYSLNGQSFLVAAKASYTGVTDTSSNLGTVATILSGSNGYLQKDGSDRYFSAEVTTGWYDAQNAQSDILVLRGMAHAMGSQETDVFVLALTYDAAQVTDTMLASGTFGLATLDDDGNWVLAVSKNSSGTAQFVQGAWDDSYTLGTWGVDTTSGTVWAVLNYNACFAAVNGLTV